MPVSLPRNGIDRVVPDGPGGGPPDGLTDGPGGAIRPPEEWREVFTLEDAVDNAPPGQDTTLRDPSLRRDGA